MDLWLIFVQIQLNFYSSSESDEEDLHEPSASVCSVNVIEVAEDDLSSQLSRLNVDGLDHAKGTTSNHSATTKDLNDPLEASHNVTMKILDGCVPWRSALLETYIWYASYGSNMWRPRFLCYIEGGKVYFFVSETFYYPRFFRLSCIICFLLWPVDWGLLFLV